MFDYIVLPTCTIAEFSQLQPLAVTPFQQGHCRVRLASQTETSTSIITAPEGDYALPDGELLGVFA